MSNTQMAEVQRGSARREGIINFDFDTIWELLCDWGNQEWWANEMEGDAGMEVSRTYLIGDKDKVPRTKVIERSNAQGLGLPTENRETLFLEDPVARRLYYDASDGFIEGVRNYIASWSFDPLPGGCCKMIITAHFDVMEPGNSDAVRNIVEAVYDLIFKNINDYLEKREK